MDRVTQLRNLILKAKQAYYFGTLSRPLMLDPEYDALEDELAQISPLGKQDPMLLMVGAPLPPDHILEAATHSMPMFSQDKVNFEEEARERLTEIATGGKIHCGWKGDGASASAEYVDGMLKMGISRGDGKVGENVTASVAKFKAIPIYAIRPDGKPLTGSIRFEAILTKDDWAKIGGKNPRNQGSGVVGRKDGIEAEFMTAYAFDVVVAGTEFQTETEKMQYLEQMGVNVMPWKVVDTVDEAVAFHHGLMSRRGKDNSGTLPFWIDGSVFKADSLARQKELGMAPGDKYHKGQVCWKPDIDAYPSKVLRLHIAGGHTGSLVPNAEFEPTEIGGTTIRRALLNNFEEVQRLGIAEGDSVLIYKSNEIIPKVLRVTDRAYRCPECGFKGTLKEQQIHHK